MWKVFTAKTLYRTKSLDKLKKRDKYYRENLDLIEERIVSIKARNFDEAIAKAEKEALSYALQTEYINPYGQTMKQEYIGSIDIFEPFDDIPANIELFSVTFLIDSTVTNFELTDNTMGKEYEDELHLRQKFFNSEFSNLP